MRKYFIVILILSLFIVANEASAQFNQIGGGILLATGGKYKVEGLPYYNRSLGLNARLEYDLNKKIKIVPALNFYFPNKEEFLTGGESVTTLLALNVNVHYIFNPRQDVNLYLLGGGHAGMWKIKDDHGSNQGTVDVNEIEFAPGLNVGGGLKFYIGNRTQVFAEAKYLVAKANQLVFNPGILYEF